MPVDTAFSVASGYGSLDIAGNKGIPEPSQSPIGEERPGQRWTTPTSSLVGGGYALIWSRWAASMLRLASCEATRSATASRITSSASSSGH